MTDAELLAIIAQAEREGWTELDLSGKGLERIPPESANLANLTTFSLSGNQITAIPDAIANLANLTRLDLNSNQITAIPDTIANLANLTTLDLSSNQITAIPDAIANLANLTTLDLSNNKITAIPNAILNLINLTMLALRGNKITAIPDAISNLANLTTLYLGNNQITAIPDAISNLSNLTKLSLWSNQINAIPDSISSLTNLTSLDLDSNQITAIPDAIANLANLTTFSLDSNQITAIPDAIANLVNLTKLDLNSNQITAIPDTIANLANLTTFSLDSNQITAIPDTIANLANLTTFSLDSNQITAIPDAIANLTKLKYLDLRGNPISIPRDILAPSDKYPVPSARPILDYYFRIQDPKESTQIYEAKILIVGEGGSGKTSLANKLIDADYQLKPEAEDTSTQGIDILRWEFTGRNQQTYKVNIWDFGGQDIYHQTHQFFLTERTLYLLVADSRKEDTDHYFWLQVIRLYGKDSPVLLIQNEKQNLTCNLNLRELRAEFEHLKTPQSINLIDNRGLAEIKETIQRNLEDLLPNGIPFPNSWLNVRYALENDGRNYISCSEYESICRLHKITDPQEILDISDLLHRLGICLHFQNDAILRHRLILKPNWGTAAVYKILDNAKVKKELGQFCDDDLRNIWRESQYNNMRHELLQLMKEFKVCYEIPHHKGHYIAPHLLQKDPPNYDDWDTSQNLILRYRYKIFMPKGILSRFIVEMHQKIENVSDPDLALVWKYGVVLNRGNTRAEVTERTHDREIRIRLSGSSQRDFLTIINNEFEKIHDRFENRLEYDTLIPCNCPICKTASEPYSYPLDELKRFVDNKQPNIQCYKSFELVNVRRLLDDSIDPDRDRKLHEMDYDISSTEDRRSRDEKEDNRGNTYNFYAQTGQVIAGNLKPQGKNTGMQNNNLSQNADHETSHSNQAKGKTKTMKTILMLAANPKNTVNLRLQEEERDIKERLRLAGYGIEPIKIAVAVRPRDIQQAILDFKPHIIHFSGHGANEDGLVFEDINGTSKLISGDALADLFDLFSDRIECVVLNACFSQTQAEAICQKIHYVIGMEQAIEDRVAIEFAVSFYAAIGAGESYELAFKLGCNAIRLAGISQHKIPQLLIRS